jgi:hypothetical protein
MTYSTDTGWTGGESGRGAQQPTQSRRDAAARPHGTGLLRAELHRFVSRRFIRWLLGLAILGYAGLVPLIAYTQFERTTPAVRAEAQREVDRIVAEQNQYRAACLKNPLPSDAPKGMTPEEFCGPAGNPADLQVDQFLPRQPFVLGDALQPGALAVGAATAALLFVIGATWIGAEWSARTMTALLFWETRRLRVLTVKVFVLTLVAGVIGALAQAVWIGSAWAIASTRGTTSGLPKHFWSDVAALDGRCTLLAVLVALIGFAVAHLVRYTGAALGVGFVYFAIVENAVGGVRPGWQPWLLSTNAAALVLKGGITLAVPGTSVDRQSGQVQDYHDVTVSNLHGGLVFGGVTLALLLVGAWLFRRRDLT